MEQSPALHFSYVIEYYFAQADTHDHDPQIFDYFLTLELEVELIWKARWTLGKVAFLLARYPTFVDVPLILVYSLSPNLSFQTCSLLNYVTSYSKILIVDFILLMVNETSIKRYRNSRNRLVITLYKDGILYFVYIFLISTTYIIILLACPIPARNAQRAIDADPPSHAKYCSENTK
ncbi:hypothetical protein BDZ94DRAFT_1236571 [Collybia nuda]|uniref:DUF6533 domain-containing protein n=1 Tax=Collybia nuda TaxID=64659 RepID=A0A9P5Y5R6_9AGAR|nr:hypothetical protein BDZ94DRAFT_1236571 [Collybia nuda]